MKKFKSWFDFKTKFKQILRSIFYLPLFRDMLCLLVVAYLYFVYFSSRKKFIGYDSAIDIAKDKKPILLSFWHNRLILNPFSGRYLAKKANGYKITTISSKHGDGQYIGRLMTMFGFGNIYGSTRDGRKSSRGISVSSMRSFIRVLKDGGAIGITPDGPKGPNKKINGQLIEIAQMTSAYIVPTNFSSSRFIALNSWDRMKVPLPFSKIVFYCLDPVRIAREEDAEEAKRKIEQLLDKAQDMSENYLNKF